MTPPRSARPRAEPPGAPPAEAPPGSPAARRRAAHALGDAALVAALATRDNAVWAEFDARFRPVLTGYARRTGIPTALWPRCVDDVLADEAMRWSEGAQPPAHLGTYLIRAVYHAFLKTRREATRRAFRYAAAASLEDGDDASYAASPGAEPVVAALCSAAARRASAGARRVDGGPAGWGDDASEADDAAAEAGARGTAIVAALSALTAELSDVDRQLLVWVAEQVPRRQIAAWLGDNYEATRKRVQRLSTRLRVQLWQYAATRPPAERHQLERLFRRAGCPASDAPPTLRDGAARAAGARPGTSPTPGRAAPPAEDVS